MILYLSQLFSIKNSFIENQEFESKVPIGSMYWYVLVLRTLAEKIT